MALKCIRKAVCRLRRDCHVGCHHDAYTHEHTHAWQGYRARDCAHSLGSPKKRDTIFDPPQALRADCNRHLVVCKLETNPVSKRGSYNSCFNRNFGHLTTVRFLVCLREKPCGKLAFADLQCRIGTVMRLVVSLVVSILHCVVLLALGAVVKGESWGQGIRRSRRLGVCGRQELCGTVQQLHL